jgi:hypothetical protein
MFQTDLLSIIRRLYTVFCYVKAKRLIVTDCDYFNFRSLT